MSASAYVVCWGSVDYGGSTPLAVFAGQEQAEQWQEQVREAYPQYFAGPDARYGVFTLEQPVPFIPSGAAPPDPSAAISD
jgi:hypothetical protein